LSCLNLLCRVIMWWAIYYCYSKLWAQALFDELLVNVIRSSVKSHYIRSCLLLLFYTFWRTISFNNNHHKWSGFSLQIGAHSIYILEFCVIMVICGEFWNLEGHKWCFINLHWSNLHFISYRC
jgi:hypothetical protein